MTSEDKAVATTESAVVWCGHLKRSADMKYEPWDHKAPTFDLMVPKNLEENAMAITMITVAAAQ